MGGWRGLIGMKPLEPGTLFGDRYEILEAVGDGGMGQVYRAVQLPLGQEVAIKLLGTAATADLEERFEREAHATARLDHPGCVRIVDFGRAAERQFIAMELLRGPTLAEVLLETGALAIAQATHITRDLLGAIAHAHGRGVLHRDVKPANVMLVERGAVLIDFGLATLRDDAHLTQAGACVGSPSYIAPERLRGEPADERADVYSVGVILYEMLGGMRPFIGSSSREIMESALARPPRPLRVLRPEIGAALEAVVARALAKDPARRYVSAAAMLGALEVALAERALPGAAASSTSSASGSTMLQLVFTEPSRWARLWTWLRYGTWRWRAHRA